MGLSWLLVGLDVVEPGKRLCIIFWTDSRLLHVGVPSGVSVSPSGLFLGLVIILASLLVSAIVLQLSMKESQLSRFAFLVAF